MNILGISGSLRRASTNTALVREAEKLLGNRVTFEWADINLPLFNEDLEAEFPEAATKLKEQILKADGILISTPEYNRSTSGVLKNAIDWASRPYGNSAWGGKPVLVIGAAYGSPGSSLGQYHLKQSLLHLDMKVMGQPEFFLSESVMKFNEAGELTDENTREHLSSALDRFLEFIQNN